MVSAAKAVALFFLGLALHMNCCWRCSMATVYEVGGSAGWTTAAHVDYQKWAATKNFHVGDTILFEYDPKKYNVMRVTHESFQRCNATTPQAIYTTGNDSIPIKGTGHLYFICGFPGNCQSGQKIDIRVAGSSRPASSPAPAPAPAPSPFGYSSGSGPPSLRHSKASLLLLLAIFTALAC